jgi:hypothetical protein
MSTGGAGSTSRASGAPLGAGCVPVEESAPTFQAFSVENVSVESKSATCASGLCLLNHFQGRVTCPYGQSSPGVGPTGPAGSPAAAVDSQDGCILPGATPSAKSTAWQVTATDVSVPGYTAGQVPPQLVGAGAANRTANETVYCSCRCANADGKTDDGATYCACPSGFACTQLIAPIGGPENDAAGAYCMRTGTGYTPGPTTATCQASVAEVGEPGYCPAQH